MVSGGIEVKKFAEIHLTLEAKFADDPLTLLFLWAMLTYFLRFYSIGESILEIENQNTRLIWQSRSPKKTKFSSHIGTSRLVCSANQWTGFIMIGKLVVNGLIVEFQYTQLISLLFCCPVAIMKKFVQLMQHFHCLRNP